MNSIRYSTSEGLLPFSDLLLEGVKSGGVALISKRIRYTGPRGPAHLQFRADARYRCVDSSGLRPSFRASIFQSSEPKADSVDIGASDLT